MESQVEILRVGEHQDIFSLNTLTTVPLILHPRNPPPGPWAASC